MSLLTTNPFLDPRAADSLNGEEYVRCFSPYLVKHLPEMFAKGNLILRGTIGCGKSMILRLLDAKVRLAYYKDGQPFPVPESQCRFIGSGINLSKSGILDFIQRLPPKPRHKDIQRLSAIFVDYLNYWIVDDLLESSVLMMNNKGCFGELINDAKLSDFVTKLTAHACWVGYLSSCETLKQVRERIDDRLNHLRAWANWNRDNLDPEIGKSKGSVGEPIASTIVCMKESGFLHEDAIAFIRIDQVEELLHKDQAQIKLTDEFRRQIYRAVGRRDGRLFYRIGTRNYDENFVMPGGRELEESRDYILKDFDTILRRGENPKNWLFKGFAEDVFKLRLTSAFPQETLKHKTKTPLFKQFFGSSPSPNELIRHIVVRQGTAVDSLLNLEELPPAWQNYIRAVYQRKSAISKESSEDYKIDPIGAALVYAWALQNGGKVGKPARCKLEDPPSLESKAPWTVWWEKEHVKLALLQLTAKHKQRLLWWGSDDVLALSSNNITLFLSICRETWELWQRDLRGDGREPVFGQIGSTVQRVAIDNISKQWHKNFKRQPGRPGGDVRIPFIDRVFGYLRNSLLNDKAMRHPGANGFSVREDDLAEHPDLKQLLDECVAWGDLERISHTSKHSSDKTRGERYKYYANSILAPYYQIFESHTKEPQYLKASDLLRHAFDAKAIPRKTLEPTNK